MASLDEIKKTAQEYFVSKSVKKVWVFGSYARGEQTASSDIDIIIDYGNQPKPSLFTLATLKDELENLFNTKVDLVPEDCIYDNIRPFIDKDKILIYERM